MEQPKRHPSYLNRPTPTLQLLSKLSKFQGQKTDDINQRAFQMPSANQNVPDLVNQPTINEIRNALPPVGQPQSTIENNPLDPNQKPPSIPSERPSTAHRSKYDTHMNSSMGKILISNPANAPPEINIPGKKLLDPTLSNYNNSVIGGQPPNGDPYATTAQIMNSGEAAENKHHSRKKLLRPFEPELFVSPITGEPIANYGTWAEELKASQSGSSSKTKEPEEQEDDEKNDPIMYKLKGQIKLRGAKGVIGLSRVFKIMDDDGSKTLSFQEFKKAMKEMGMVLNDSELIILFKRFDISKTGAISYNDFIVTISGRLNGRRRRFVEMAFNILDKDGSGEIELADIIANYNASAHPDVISGKRTETQVLTEFLDTFEAGGNRDGKVSREEFEAYYRGLSASIDSDDYFELMMRNAWHISGGEGQSANSSNKRVLVTHSDGSQSVVEIQNDLGLKPNDKSDIMRRLKAQGVDVIAVSTGAADGGGEDNKMQFTNNNKKPMTRNGRPATAGNRSPNRTLLNKPGTDLAPVQRSAEPSAGLKLILQRIKDEMKKRGSFGFIGMQRRFKIMDDDGSGSLSLAEFKKAMKEMKIELAESDLRMVFDFFDSDQSGSIDFNEFIQGVREPMNEKRLKFVNMAFTILDKDGSGEVETQEIASAYDASKHPEVLAKRKTANQVLREFLDTFDVGGVKDGKVTRQEFQNYYHNISASIDNDDYFELMMRNAWHIAGGEGQAANSTNMTVLVTNSYGQNRTVMLQNDLGVKKDDYPTIYARLKSQGIDDIAAINGRMIKILNINGVDVVSTPGDVSESTKLDNRIEPAKVNKAPPFQQNRPKSAAPIAANGARSRPIAGANPVSFGGPTSASLKTSAPVLAGNVISSMQQKQVQQAKQTEQLIAGKTLLDVLRMQLLSRGAGGMIEMQRSFQRIDTDQSRTIDLTEFQAAIKDMNIPFSLEQIQTLFNFIDVDQSGGIDFQEFLDSLRGPLSPNVFVLVNQIFDRLDVAQTGFISPQDVMGNYDATRHPDVATGMRTAEQVMQEFLNTFDVGASQPGKISRDEFVTYYQNIAPSVNDDDYLLTILKRTWRMREDIEVPPDYLLTSNTGVSGAGGGGVGGIKGKIASAQNFAQGYYANNNNNNNNNAQDAMLSSSAVRRPSTAGAMRRPSGSVAAAGNAAALAAGGIAPSTPFNLTGNGESPMMIPPRGDQSFNRPGTNQGIRYRPTASTSTAASYGAQNNAASVANQTTMLQQRVQEMEKAAILAYNQGKYNDSEQSFKAMLNMLRTMYPSNHPECVKVEKSILMVQRKTQLPR